MSFIGILTEHKNETYLKKQLESKQWGEVFFLDENTLKNMHNIKFETFLFGKKIKQNQDIIRSMAQKVNYFIVNSDIKENVSTLNNLDLRLITYGYNQKATITTSSVEENKIMICLQRSIKNIYQEEIEPQEIEMEVLEKINDEAIMEFASLSLIYSQRKK